MKSYFGFLLMLACSSQTVVQEAQKKEVKVEKATVASSPTTLLISDGSAKGSNVEIPADAIPEGSQVTLDKSDTPDEFTLAKDDSDAEISKASPAVIVNATDSSGKEIEAFTSPMTLSIPYEDGYSLSDIEKTTDNLCVFLKSSKFGLYLWRKNAITVDTTKSVVEFKSSYPGIFQLVYCGQQEVSGFTDASKSDAIAPLENFKLTVDGTQFDLGQDALCILVSQKSETETVLLSSRKDMVAASMEFSHDYAASLVSGDVFLYLFFQSKNQTCELEEGDVVTTGPEFMRSIKFTMDAAAFKKGEASATLGAGDLALSETKLKYGVPPTAAMISINPQSSKAVCVYSEDVTLQGTLIQSTLSTKQMFDGESALRILTPSSDVGNPLHLLVGADCSLRDSTTFDENAEPYSLALQSSIADIFYVIAAQVNVPELPFPSSNSVCLKMYPGTALSETSTSVSNEKSDRISQWSLDPGSSVELVLPWDTTKTNSETQSPVIDFMVKPNSNCLEDLPSDFPLNSIPVNDKEISPEMSL